MKRYGLKSWWNLRNDDIFVHRWGDPDYVRAFIGHFQKEHTAGFYMGSDGYVWGKEFISKNPELAGQLEIKKHWVQLYDVGQIGITTISWTRLFLSVRFTLIFRKRMLMCSTQPGSRPLRLFPRSMYFTGATGIICGPSRVVSMRGCIFTMSSNS